MSILTAKEQLQKMLDDQFVRNHPNVPDYAKPKPKANKSPANQLTNDIIKYLELNKHQAERINSMGRVLNGKYITSTSTNGTADISSTIKVGKSEIGLSVKWEVKIKKDKQSEAQKKYEDDVKRAKGEYFIVKTFDDFIEKYNDLLKKFASL